MRSVALTLLLSLGLLLAPAAGEMRLGPRTWSAATRAAGFDQTPGPAPAAAPPTDRTVDNVTVSRPTWHRGGGLLYGEVTIRNHNPYAVRHVIISCDFFDEWGNKIGSKGTALERPISPGRTRFSGIQFSATIHNMEGGACRVISAEPL